METTTLGKLMCEFYGPRSQYFSGAKECAYIWGGNGDSSSTVAPFNDYSYNVVKSVFTYDTKYHNLRTSYSFNVPDTVISEYRQYALFNNFHALCLESDKYPVTTGYFNMSNNATVIPVSATAITLCDINDVGDSCYTQAIFIADISSNTDSREITIYQRKLSPNRAPNEWNSVSEIEDLDTITEEQRYFCTYNAYQQNLKAVLLDKLSTYNSAVSVTGASGFKKCKTETSSADILSYLSPKLHIKDSLGTVGTQITSVSDFEKALTYCKVTYNSANQPTAYGIPLYGRSLTGQIQVIYDGNQYKFDGFTAQYRLTSVAYSGSGGYSYSAGMICDDIVWTTGLSISGSNMSVTMPYAEMSIRYNNFKSSLATIDKVSGITTDLTSDDIINYLDMRVNYSSFLDFAPGTFYANESYTTMYKLQSVMLALQDAATNNKGLVFADTGSRINVSKKQMTINSVVYNICWQLSGEEWITFSGNYKLCKWILILAFYNNSVVCLKNFAKIELL